MKGRPAAGNVDYTKWNEYQLCKEFKWRPSQLREELAEDIELYVAFLNMEREVEKAKQNKRTR